MALNWIKRWRRGRRPSMPQRETKVFPGMTLVGQPNSTRRFVYKPTPLNIRYFSKTTYARRAINAIRNPICQLEWQVLPCKGIGINSELQRQMSVAMRCLDHPNEDDSARSLMEAVFDDIMCGAGAIEQQLSSDPMRPLWLWPVDGLSIQIFPQWSGNSDEARYLQTAGYGTVGGSREGISLRNDELVYIRPSPSTATPFGLGPLEVAFLSIARKLGVEKYSGDLSTNASPPGILYAGPDFDEGALRAFRSYWKNEVEGQGMLPVLGGTEIKDLKYINLVAEGDKALYLAYQEMLVREIATAFDLSPQNFGVERDVNRDTAEASIDRDWDHAIRPYADLFASYITRETIQAKLGFSQLEFKFIGLDRDDEKATADILKTYYDINVLTPIDIADRLGHPRPVHQFADKCYAETMIAIRAAQGVGAIEDKSLPPAPVPQAKPKPAVPGA